MPNQYTAETADRRAKNQRDDWKDRISAGNILNRLEQAGEGLIDLTPTQIKAYEVVLDRVVPRLSSTELTEVNELDTLSRDQILERIQALLKADPSLLPELVGLQAREVSNAAVQTVVTPPGSTTAKR